MIGNLKKALRQKERKIQNMNTKKTRKVKLAIVPNKCELGATGCLVKSQNVITGQRSYDWYAGSSGLCNNSGDTDTTYTSGWLGTNDDVAEFAQGLWQIMDIQHNGPTKTYSDGSVTLIMQQVEEVAK